MHSLTRCTRMPFTLLATLGKQQHLDLLIEPRRGCTRKLLDLGRVNKKLLDIWRANEQLHGKETENESAEDDIVLDGLQSPLVLFSGPHGLSAPVGDYEAVLMIASGFVIASQLPYLKQLLYGYNACKTRNRRIRLVWQLETDGKRPPRSKLPDHADPT
jgi:hypothetical protein